MTFRSEVEPIYLAYPRKVGKNHAVKAIERAIERIVGQKDLFRNDAAAELLRATKAYAAATSKWSEEERKFIPYPATWFNQGRYEDDPAEWARSNKRGGEYPQADKRAKTI